ncbi:uncharacterized protein LOC126824844 [Patella vulgata]|uniref:uncharacterized protein LOC126824844 n=1 Tax=Patella vulgata TaxID=6465 RepID=UPI00217F60D2|nr:uncharacterized protein LOC126824844 [Patella vulgata]
MGFSLLYLTVLVWSPLVTETAFTWKETENPVRRTVRQRVELVWKYETYQSVNSMIFIRARSENMSDDKVPVGKWTQEEGFKPDPFISTMLEHVIENIEGTNKKKVSLILKDPINIDYGLHYNCQVDFGDSVPMNLSIKLIALRPKWIDNSGAVKAREGEDAELIWSYTYPYITECVFISRKLENETTELGYWFRGEFNITDPSYIDRVIFEKSNNKRSTNYSEEIKVTLKNVTDKDFNYTYVGRLILSDGEELTKDLSLKEVKVPLSPVSKQDHANSARNFHSNALLLLVALFLNLDKTWWVAVNIVTQPLASTPSNDGPKSEQNVEG